MFSLDNSENAFLEKHAVFVIENVFVNQQVALFSLKHAFSSQKIQRFKPVRARQVPW